MYTEFTAEGWADKKVSDGGLRSLYIQYKCTELENDESDNDDKSGTVPVYCQTFGLSKVCAKSQQKRCNSLKFAQIQKC